MANLRSKNRTSSQSIGYNGLNLVKFPTVPLDGKTFTPAAPAGRIVLPFACKIVAVAADASLGAGGTLGGAVTLNIALGSGPMTGA